MTYRKFLITLLCVACIACSTTPENAVPGRITVIADTRSPYWATQINKYFPRALNDYANYQIVDGRSDAKYKVVVRILNANSYASGMTQTSNFNTNIKYRTKAEMEVLFINPIGRVVYKWRGWSDHQSGAHATKYIAKMFG